MASNHKKLFFAQVQRHSALHNWSKAKGRRTFDKGNDNCQPVEALIMNVLVAKKNYVNVTNSFEFLCDPISLPLKGFSTAQHILQL